MRTNRADGARRAAQDDPGLSPEPVATPSPGMCGHQMPLRELPLPRTPPPRDASEIRDTGAHRTQTEGFSDRRITAAILVLPTQPAVHVVPECNLDPLGARAT